jgi:hypothetical protein
LRYQLATRHTSLVVVAERATGEKQDALPETIAVAQMLAAGWGGHGTVEALSEHRSPRVCRAMPQSARAAYSRSPHVSSAHSPPSDFLDIPAFLRKQGGSDSISPSRRLTVREATAALSPGVAGAIVESLDAAYRTDGRLPDSIDSLQASHPLTLDLAEALRALVDGGESEADVLAVFYAVLGDVAERGGGAPGFVTALRGGGFARRGLRQLRARVRKWFQ